MAETVADLERPGNAAQIFGSALRVSYASTSSLIGGGNICVNAKVYKGSVGPVSNQVVSGPGSTEMAVT